MEMKGGRWKLLRGRRREEECGEAKEIRPKSWAVKGQEEAMLEAKHHVDRKYVRDHETIDYVEEREDKRIYLTDQREFFCRKESCTCWMDCVITLNEESFCSAQNVNWNPLGTLESENSDVFPTPCPCPSQDSREEIAHFQVKI